MRSIVLGTALALMATSAHAAFTISGGTSFQLGVDGAPYNPDLNAETGNASALEAWTNNSTTVKRGATVDITPPTTLPVKLTYLGFEAGFTNAVTLQASVAGEEIFRTDQTPSGTPFIDVSVLNSGNFSDLEFRVDDNSDSDGLFNNGTFSLNSNNAVAVGFADMAGDVLQVGFNDTGTDADFDDLVFQAAVVPLPAAVWMFGAGLAAVGGSAYRRRRGERAARA